MWWRNFYYSTYSFKCSLAKTRLTLVFCTSQLQTNNCFKTKRATAQAAHKELKASFAILKVQYTVTRVENVVQKIFILSIVIKAFKKSVMFLCKPFGKSLLGIQRLGSISTCYDQVQKYWDTPKKKRPFLLQIAPGHRSVRYNTDLPPPSHSKLFLQVLSMVLYC